MKVFFSQHSTAQLTTRMGWAEGIIGLGWVEGNSEGVVNRKTPSSDSSVNM